MIEIRPARKEIEFPMIKRLFEDLKYRIAFESMELYNWMVVVERGELIGAASLLHIENAGLIECIFINKNRRNENLGEGLVKSLLNYADTKGISWVISSTKELNFFYNKIGFRKASVESALAYKEIFAKKDIDLNNIMEVKLPDYFATVCKSSYRT